jgi:hypothetical protein
MTSVKVNIPQNLNEEESYKGAETTPGWKPIPVNEDPRYYASIELLTIGHQSSQCTFDS